jgi:glycosyltransferase involved in cell wall biosynthesis
MLAPFAWLPSSRRPVLVYETHTLPAPSTWSTVRRAELVVVNSRKLEVEIAARLELSSDTVLHAPLCPYADIRPVARETARERLGLGHDVSIACYSGKMTPDQNEFLLQLARAAGGRIDDFRLLLVGGNPGILEWTRARVRELGLEDAVITSGFVSPTSVGLYQCAADVLILYMSPDFPHYPWCTPAKGFDYQASGRPIVASDIPLFDEVFGADGERAIRVPQATPEAFADAIESVLTLEDEGGAMAERARAWITSRTWQARADAVLERLGIST